MDHLLGTGELALRYGVRRPRAWRVVDEWRRGELPGPCPEVRQVGGRNLVRLDQVETWEHWMSINGYELPGEMRPGPKPY